MKIYQLFYYTFILIFSSCNEFLDEKPDIKMVVPKTLKDAELLINDYTTMNIGYPLFGELGTDGYYITEDSWESITNYEQRNAYTWIDESYNDAVQWQRPYKVVYMANQILSILNEMKDQQNDPNYTKIAGASYFFRAFAFHQLAEVYAPVYTSGTAANEMGIPLRLDPGIDVPSVRASLAETYEQIIQDYHTAVRMLPAQEPIKGRPHRAAAYAGLARVYLGMSDYERAYRYADSCLQLKSELLDFNDIDASEELPIPAFNKEILFPAMSAGAGGGPMGYYYALVDPVFYKSYAVQDLRRRVFFELIDFQTEAYGFKGNFNNSRAQLFVGLTTSEVYLIKAESAVRTGKLSDGIAAINTLLEKRWRTGLYNPITETNPEVLLKLILMERQKELFFRGRRWADLKRLNLDPQFKKTLTRNVDAKNYQLEPNSLKYAFKLPETVVRLGKIPQNKR